MANKDAPPDTQLDLKKRARRRLVGAIALALLAVIVLPMVMEHEPLSTGKDIQIHIPDSRPDDLPSPLPAAGPPVMATARSQPPEVPAAPQGETQQAIVSNTKPVETAADKTPPPASEEQARAVAALNGAEEQWLVRLGAYQNAVNVKVLVAKVKETGIAVYTEKFESSKGPRTRVLAGPFTSREAAEKAQARIKKLGVDGTVIAKQ